MQRGGHQSRVAPRPGELLGWRLALTLARSAFVALQHDVLNIQVGQAACAALQKRQLTCLCSMARLRLVPARIASSQCEQHTCLCRAQST